MPALNASSVTRRTAIGAALLPAFAALGGCIRGVLVEAEQGSRLNKVIDQTLIIDPVSHFDTSEMDFSII